MTDRWEPLHEELTRWPAPPLLWLRDDDAVGPTPPLAKLLALSAEADIPVCAAVIPSRIAPGFAAWLGDQGAPVTVVPHGWAHLNHAPADEKKAEFGDHRPARTMENELREALLRTEAAFEERARPIFVPPWNRIGPRASGCLASAGYTALSATGSQTRGPVTGVTVADVHIDIIDWRGGRAFRGLAAVLGDLCARLATVRQNKRGEPTGILTHHAVHDAAAWDFLRTLCLAFGDRFRWATADEVVADARAGSRA